MSQTHVIQFGDKDLSKVEKISTLLLSYFTISQILTIDNDNENNLLFKQSKHSISEIFKSFRSKNISCVNVNLDNSNHFFQIYKPLFFGSHCDFWQADIFLPMELSVKLIEEIDDKFKPDFILISNEDSIDLEDYDCIINNNDLETNKKVIKYYINRYYT